MKRLLVTGLSTLAIIAAAPVYAQQIAATNQNMGHSIVKVTPVNLVQHGYQGYFSEQGIPSGGAFLNAVRTKKIHAEDLVKGAIARGRLSQETLNDRSYLHAVQIQLSTLNRD
jgi:hypothetical protein